VFGGFGGSDGVGFVAKEKDFLIVIFKMVSFFLFAADRAGLQQKDVLEVLELTNMASQMILEKGQCK
jgi:hypothetical protein